MEKKLVDRYGREVYNLRISVTNSCNLNCIYCHREGHIPDENEMTVDEIERIVKIAADLGFYEVKITGGEPLVRRDIVEIVSRIASDDRIKDLSMTTNGTLLYKYAEDLKEAGLNRINVTLDTLRQHVYNFITRTNSYSIEEIKKGIKKAVEVGLNPVKINVVYLKGLTEDIWEIFEFSKSVGAILQVIELIPSNVNNEFYKNFHSSLNELEMKLESMAELTYFRTKNKRRVFKIDGGLIETVRPMHNSDFCMNCHRLRVTSDGKLKPCLMRDDNLVDIITPIRNGVDDGTLRKIFYKAISLREPFFKPKIKLKSRE
ncbi:MAG: GTP 3',8-cyclase MoaA [Candidatus Asgardarchaeia archaeon]